VLKAAELQTLEAWQISAHLLSLSAEVVVNGDPIGT